VIEWAAGELARRGMRITGEPAIVHDKPWAKVARIPTDDGATFVKAIAPALAHEIPVTVLLSRIAPERATSVIAHDPERRFLLMEDAGERLRALLERDHDLRHWRGILARYAEVQLRVAPSAASLVAAGCPDLRSAALPAAFESVVADGALRDLVGPRIADATDLARVRSLVPRVREWCHELAATVPETIQHDDLHDGQVFLKDGHLRFLDWGDANISHPFFSLVVVERSIAHGFDLAEGAPELLRLRAEYLEPFTTVATRARIDAALPLALVLGRLVRALTWTRVTAALPLDRREDDAVPGWFALFAEAAEKLEPR
jgi:hypothetical protein